MMMKLALTGKGQALAVILFLLVLMLLGLVMSGRMAVSELKVSGSELNYTQAFEAAEAGLQSTIALLNAQKDIYVKDTLNNSTLAATPDGWIDPNTITQTTVGEDAVFSPTSGTFSTWSTSIANITNGDFSQLVVSSRGCSDGCSPCNASCKSSAVVSQVAGLRSLLKATPLSPLIARGSVDLQGNSTVDCVAVSPQICIRSGGATSLQKVQMTDPQGAVSQHDATLAAMTPADLFQFYFGMSQASLKAGADILCSSGSCSSSINSPDGDGTLIWIDASSSFTVNSSLASQIGSPQHPVLIIVNNPGGNNFKIYGSTTLYGLIYVIGGWNNGGGGTANVQGAVITDGDFSSTGAPDLTFNTAVINNLKKKGIYVSIAGGWSDF